MNKLILLVFLCFVSCTEIKESKAVGSQIEVESDISKDHQKILAKADLFLKQEPSPLTMFTSARSEGGIHDFYSEGDYWWPDPENPDGPYMRKDGLSNPNNFLEHRKAMRNLNEWVSALVAAYAISKQDKYADHALQHLNAFFLDPSTLMNPNLLYAQAIKGRHSGRGIGIIDTIHLIEVAKSILRLKSLGKLDKDGYEGYKNWFDQYATWMNTHKYGLDEKDHGNNHSTWWAAQMAAFAEIAEREDLMEVARTQFKKLLPLQMAADGSFPDELGRTKPYIYTLFNLEGYAILCELASTPSENLWTYEGETGSVKKAFDFMLPYMKDKSSWIKAPDVSHFDEIPIQTVGFLFAGLAYEDDEYIKLWESLSPIKQSEEVKRNFPLWYPQNWI